ncbi:MAG: DUF169 domain-containing protein [Ilumatobacteraceae bacterium]
MTTTWRDVSDTLSDTLGLEHHPIALTFSDEADPGAPHFEKPMSEPTPDGRAGRVPASCVFWMEADTATFATAPEDHGNCSVGRWVHGFATLDDIAGAADVGALFEVGWVTSDDVAAVHVIPKPSASIVYGPLADTAGDPDVVVLRLKPSQMMQLSDAIPTLEYSRKPQCQIVARAKAGQAALSMGCALSRERTGMAPDELTCAIPGRDLAGIVERLGAVTSADRAVREYAAADESRFSHR